jgi:hypothetical protein
MAVVNLDSGSGSSLNLSSEVTVRTYTAAADGYISGRLLLSSLNGAAATITVKVQLLDASDNKLGAPVSFSFAKDAAADTTTAACWGPIRVLSGQKLRVRAASTNASDSAAAWTSLMDDANAPDVSASAVASVTGAVTVDALNTGTIDADALATDAVEEIAAAVRTELSTELARIDVATSTRMATFTVPTNFGALLINASGHVSRVTLTDTLTTYTGNTPQTGDSFARLGAPVGASVSADIAAIDAQLPFTFPGARAVTITVTDDDDPAVPLSGALVRVTQSGDTELRQTDDDGEVSFSLDDGDYTLSITNGAAYSYTPETITVSAASVTFTKEMTTNSITTPSVGQCTGTLLVVDPLGAPDPNVVITFEAKGAGATDGYAYDSTASTSTSNGSGVVTRLFPSGSIPYRWRRGTGQWIDFTTAAASGASFDIPSHVGKP